MIRFLRADNKVALGDARLGIDGGHRPTARGKVNSDAKGFVRTFAPIVGEMRLTDRPRRKGRRR